MFRGYILDISWNVKLHISDAMDGQLEVTPLKESVKFDEPNYEEVP